MEEKDITDKELDSLFQSSITIHDDSNDQSTQEKQEDNQDTSKEEESKEDSKVVGTSSRKQLLQEKIEKNKKTVFIGNVSINVTDKSHYKLLYSTFSQYGKIESIRFRSIAFSEGIPRKVAFLQKKFHSKRDTLNAYIVYKDGASVDAALVMNGKVLFGKHLRVDRTERTVAQKFDDKKSVFIGNLPFDASEEPLWEFFEDCGEIQSVRIVRDKKTNVGKGFGYVEFKEKASVSLALKLNGKDCQSRPIRITKCQKETSTTEGMRASSESNKVDKKKDKKKKKNISRDKKKIKSTKELVKSFEYRTEKNLVLQNISTNTTIRELENLIKSKIQTLPGYKPYLNVSFDTLKIYVKAHGSKTSNLIINLDHHEWILNDKTATLSDVGIENETELSFFNLQDYENYLLDPQQKW